MSARFVVLRLRCPGTLGSCSPVCLRGVLCRVCGVLGHLVPVYQCLLGAFPCLFGVLGHLVPVQRCGLSVRCVADAVSCATWLLLTAVPAPCVVLRVRCPGPLGFRSPVCLLGKLCPVCGVLGHLAPVHRCTSTVCCFACAVSRATSLLFIGVPARCVVLRLRCPWQLGFCSPVCPLGESCCAFRVLSHLAPVPWCASAFCCVARAVSWATWLLFTSVPARCVLLSVRCPGPFGSCSPVCPLGVFCRACGALDHLAPVQWCARQCVVFGVRCPRPLGSCSPLCKFGVFCCVCGVLGHMAPVHRFARSVCCAVCCFCGVACAGRSCGTRTRPSGRWLLRSRQGRATLPGAHSTVRTAAVCSRQGPGTLRVRTRPSGRRLFCSRQGLGWLPGAHTSIRMAACVASHLFSCPGSVCLVRALRVCGTRRPLLLGTCPFALVVAGGVPLWCASWPRVVRRASSGPVALAALLGFPDAAVPFPTPGAPGLLPRPYWAAARGRRRPPENRAHCGRRWPPPGLERWAHSESYPFRAPRWGCPWRIPPALVLGCVCCDS